MELRKVENGWKLTQKKLIENGLEVFNMKDCKQVPTPMSIDRPTKEDCPEEGSKEQREMKLIPYRSIMGFLNYVSTKTRPDITFSVNLLSRYCVNPGMKHWKYAKRILRYLKGSMEKGITFNQDLEVKLEEYTDADWAQDREDRKSTSGYIFRIGEAIVSWKSKKQTTVALSTAEAEYIALSYAMREGLYLRSILKELGYEQKKPTVIHIDNQAALAWAKNPVDRQRSKHIDIKYHFIRESIQNGDFELKYCITQEMAADMMTKPLSRNQFERNLKTLKMD